jgi:hypothetical protein
MIHQLSTLRHQSSVLSGRHFPTFDLILAIFMPHLSIAFAPSTLIFMVSAKLPISSKL